MGANVCLHVSLLRKTFTANTTREWLFFRVYRTDVCLQIALLCESFATRITAIVFFAGMYFHVRIDISFLSETLTTYLL
jgi:hypothetical protein